MWNSCRGLVAATLSLGLAACDFAPSQGPLSVSREVVIYKTVPEVWGVVGDFSGMAFWHPAVTSTNILAEGKERILVLGDSATIHERLLEYVDGMSFTYEILESPLPIADYVSTIEVHPADEKTSRVVWRATFGAATGKSDNEAVDAVGGIYDAGLENLAKLLNS